MGEDIMLTCKDCGCEFLFSAGEQAFFADRGFEHRPERCRNCRKKKRQELQVLREKAKGPTEVECADCGRMVKVPFVPYQGKPVFCFKCHRARMRSASRL